MVMDWCREDRTCQFRLFSDDLTRLVPVKWFRAPEGARMFPFMHHFGQDSWFLQDHTTQVGCYNTKKQRNKVGAPPATLAGDHFCGPLRYFRDGVLLSDNPAPLAIDGRTGFPTCCDAQPRALLDETDQLGSRLPAAAQVFQVDVLGSRLPAVAYLTQVDVLASFPGSVIELVQVDVLGSRLPAVAYLTQVDTLGSRLPARAELVQVDELVSTSGEFRQLVQVDVLGSRLPAVAYLTQVDTLGSRLPARGELVQVDELVSLPGSLTELLQVDELVSLPGSLGDLDQVDELVSVPGSLAELVQVDTLGSGLPAVAYLLQVDVLSATSGADRITSPCSAHTIAATLTGTMDQGVGTLTLTHSGGHWMGSKVISAGHTLNLDLSCQGTGVSGWKLLISGCSTGFQGPSAGSTDIPFHLIFTFSLVPCGGPAGVTLTIDG